jgi:hypothetical protein
VANLVKAIGQDVAHKATKELARSKGFGALALGSEGYRALGDGEQAAIGDADSVGIAAEIGDDVATTMKRCFGVYVPRLACDAPHQQEESERVAEIVELGERTTLRNT